MRRCKLRRYKLRRPARQVCPVCLLDLGSTGSYRQRTRNLSAGRQARPRRYALVNLFPSLIWSTVPAPLIASSLGLGPPRAIASYALTSTRAPAQATLCSMRRVSHTTRRCIPYDTVSRPTRHFVDGDRGFASCLPTLDRPPSTAMPRVSRGTPYYRHGDAVQMRRRCCIRTS